MKSIILFIWQLPQSILGLIVLAVNKYIYKSEIKKGEAYFVSYYTVKYLCNSGISLGNYIIIDRDGFLTKNTVLHENGHRKQSLLLGWLYLIVIGLPSLIGNILYRKFKFSYYEQPWEKWADKLGGANR